MSDPLTVYLFENSADDTIGICQTASGAILPRTGAWHLKLSFPLAVDQPTPIGISPEPILRGLTANGYFVCDRNQISPFGTSQ